MGRGEEKGRTQREIGGHLSRKQLLDLFCRSSGGSHESAPGMHGRLLHDKSHSTSALAGPTGLPHLLLPTCSTRTTELSDYRSARLPPPEQRPPLQPPRTAPSRTSPRIPPSASPTHTPQSTPQMPRSPPPSSRSSRSIGTSPSASPQSTPVRPPPQVQISPCTAAAASGCHRVSFSHLPRALVILTFPATPTLRSRLIGKNDSGSLSRCPSDRETHS